MKILHTADLHIGMTNYSKLDPETGLESRLLDFFNTFNFIIDYAIAEKVDAFIFAGDAYKTRDPSPTQQRGFGERIKRVAKAGIPVIMVVGNHDTPNAEGKANTLDIYSALEIDNVWVSRQPELLKISTKSGILQVVTAPWLQRADFKTIADKLGGMYEKILPDLPAVLVGHLEVEGASMGSEKGLAIAGDVTVPLSLLTDRRLSYVALGHIHKHQELVNPPTGGPPVVYSGSPERIDFGEVKEEKGVVLVEISEKRKVKNKNEKEYLAEYQFITTPARKFLTINVALKADDPEPTKTTLDVINQYEIAETVVRVSIDIPAELNKELEMDKIKKALAKAHFVAGISRNVERKERQLLDGQEEVERLTPVEALQKYFEVKKYSPEKIKRLEKYAAELLG